jgi:hypothetical protein
MDIDGSPFSSMVVQFSAFGVAQTTSDDCKDSVSDLDLIDPATKAHDLSPSQ